MTFLIAMDADTLPYVKFIATYAPTFFRHIISVLAMVHMAKSQYLIEYHFIRQIIVIWISLLWEISLNTYQIR